MRHLILIAALTTLTALTGCEDKEGTPTLDAIGSDTTVSLDANGTDTATPPEDTIMTDTMEPADTDAPDIGPADVEAPDVDPADTSAPDDAVTPEDTAAPEDTTPSAGACDNEADRAELDALGTTSGENSPPPTELERRIEGCVVECISDLANFETCGATCVARETDLSAGCSACFGEVMQCTVTNCIPACLSASSEACATCRATKCTPSFEECSGVEQP